ncbi:unnamed protein product [Cylindrotheca closterium]|uniref:Uncharacterized protein n=1 Tax=Cylindrotheca closterium TaxID=2856 RepID=A0AAD2G6Z5_9STRA|nr:unnamed protein product [Cylindrotheca closterium]
MSNHNTTGQNDSTMMQPCKPKRKSVQFGRISYSDDSNDKELSVHEQMENPCKFMERSAMCSSKHIPPPSPPQRKASAEVVWDEHEFAYEEEEEESNATTSMGLSSISMNSLLDSLVTNEHAEEQKEQEEESYHSRDSILYNSPLISSRKTPSASPLAPTRTSRPRLGLSPSQRPPVFPARCL